MFGGSGLQYYNALVWNAFNFYLHQDKFLKFEVQFTMQVFIFKFGNLKSFKYQEF